jgi:23S rRNA (guanosine2251-2'-O)-methyltransferase
VTAGQHRPGRPVASLGGGQIEGYHAVHELLAARHRQVHRLWVADDPHPGPAMQLLVSLAREEGVAVQHRSGAVLAQVARTDAAQGVIAWAEEVTPVALAELLGPSEPPALLLVLDGVTDPGNFGALLRTAACAGVTGVVVARHRSAPLTPAAIKAAAGAVEHISIAQVPGVPAALLEISRAGLWVVGLDPGGDQDLWDLTVLDHPLALVVGSEGPGLSRLARQRCDLLAHIHQTGPLPSLNVAAATAVACFEVARQRHGSRG